MNAWNEALVGANPTRPRQWGSVSSKTEAGSSSSATASGL